jgi:hypothetical protein
MELTRSTRKLKLIDLIAHDQRYLYVVAETLSPVTGLNQFGN